MEIVNYRALHRPPAQDDLWRPPSANGPARPESRRSALFPGADAPFDAPVYRRAGLAPGFRIPGPAIVEEYTSTTVVYPSFELSVDARGNLRLQSTA